MAEAAVEMQWPEGKRVWEVGKMAEAAVEAMHLGVLVIYRKTTPRRLNLTVTTERGSYRQSKLVNTYSLKPCLHRFSGRSRGVSKVSIETPFYFT